MTIKIENGVVSFIYHDEDVELLDLGEARIERASHVEPAEGGGWTADMSPRGGPVLGPFKLRQAALDAEVAWLEDHCGL